MLEIVPLRNFMLTSWLICQSVFVCGHNNLSCCPWIFHLIYALSTPTTLLTLHFSLYLTSPHVYHFIIISSLSLFPHVLSTRTTVLPPNCLTSPFYIFSFITSLSLSLLPIPKYQYITVADPGAGIDLVPNIKPSFYLSELGIRSSSRRRTVQGN